MNRLIGVSITEEYEFKFADGRTVVWNVIKAKNIVREFPIRGKVEMPRDQMEIVATWDITPGKLTNADPTQPGICAVLNLPDGPGFIMIDGVHRAVKALQTNQQFFLLALSDKESRACILRADDWSMIP